MIPELTSAGEAIKKMVGDLKAALPDPEGPEHWPGSAQSVWEAHSRLVADLLARKQAYGDAWREQGYMGNTARILSKASRLRNMMWRDGGEFHDGDSAGEDGSNESVLDTLLDLSALCAFAIANIEDGNRWGK